MKKHIITKDQLDKCNNYIGDVDLTNFDGNIECHESLGWVKFISLKVTGYINFKAESGIEAGWGIEAGLGIEAALIDVRLRIFAGTCSWRLVSKKQMQIKAKIISGTIAYGELVEEVK